MNESQLLKVACAFPEKIHGKTEFGKTDFTEAAEKVGLNRVKRVFFTIPTCENDDVKIVFLTEDCVYLTGTHNDILISPIELVEG